MKKQIMKRAWEIARSGQKQFGGKVREFFSEALKIAWAEARNGDRKMKVADPTEGTIFEVEATIDQLKSIADITHTVATMATKLRVKFEKVGELDKNAYLPGQIDVAFYNGEIMSFNETSGQFEVA